MTTTASVTIENSTASISGTLNHASVPPLLKQLATGGFSKIDLQKTTHSNSAGVAMLLELVEQGKHRGETINIVNLPPQMQRVAKLSGVADLL